MRDIRRAFDQDILPALKNALSLNHDRSLRPTRRYSQIDFTLKPIPIFLMFRSLGLNDTHAGMILLYTAINLSLAVWLINGFIDEIPIEYEVCGDVFASPSVDAVLAGILAVTGPAGCLLIIKNYTDDRLNFGLAAERAKTFGLDVNMVIVDDDVALPDLPQA